MKWLRVRKRLYQRAEAGCVEMVFTKYNSVRHLKGRATGGAGRAMAPPLHGHNKIIYKLVYKSCLPFHKKAISKTHMSINKMMINEKQVCFLLPHLRATNSIY